MVLSPRLMLLDMLLRLVDLDWRLLGGICESEGDNDGGFSSTGCSESIESAAYQQLIAPRSIFQTLPSQ